MNEIFKLFGSIGLHTDEAEDGLERVHSKGEESADNLRGTFTKAAGFIGGVFAAGKIIDFGKDTIQAAADADAIRSQYSQVFGDMTGQADKMAAGMASKFGMIPDQLSPGMVKFQSMFRGVGLSSEQAMKMTGDATTAAADAAAFANVSYDDAQGSLQSFILGNYDAGDAIGIQANDNAVAQYAIQQGAAKTTADWQKMGDAQKEQMRLGFVQHMQQLSGVQGQAQRESGSYAVQMDKLKAVWQQFLAEVGKQILPTAINVIKGAIPVIQNMIGKFRDLVTWAKQNADALKAVGVAVGVAVAAFKTVQVIQGVISGVRNAMNLWKNATTGMTVAQRLLNLTMAANPIGIVIALIAAIAAGLIYFFTQTKTGQAVFAGFMNWLRGAWQGISDFFSGLWQGITGFFTSAGQNIQSAWNGIMGWFGSVPGRIAGFFSGIGERIGGFFTSIPGKIQGIFNDAVNFVRGIPGQIAGFFSGMSISLPHISLPHFSLSGNFNPLKGEIPHIGIDWYAKGGIMNGATPFGMNGNNLMVGGEAGQEAILPLNRENLGMIGEKIAATMGGNNAEIVAAVQEMAANIVAAVMANKDFNIDGQALTDRIETILMKGTTA